MVTIRRTALALLAATALAAGPLRAQGTPDAPAAPADPTAPSLAVAPTSAEDERAVLAVVERLFDAMRARDTAAMRAAFLPGASLTTTSVRDGQPTVQRDSIEAFVRSVAGAPPGLLLDERLRDPQVRASDGLASVWVHYDFHAGERFSHCGIDAIVLARTAEGWRIAHVADTRRREGCPGKP